MKVTEDQELWQRIRLGDYPALTALFERYYQAMCRFMATIVSDYVWVEELTADIFVRLWQGRNHLMVHDVKSYLFAAARNQAYQAIKQKQGKRQLPVQGMDHVSDGDTAHNQNPEQAMISTEQVQQIEDLVNVLPPRCKEVFYLSRVEQFSYQQIATQLNISEKTVENQMGKALRLLRRAYQQLQA